ncbi:MAG TPA: hypothetical protein VGO48_03995 [Conexibacter sp.]|jgi:hypothetical protein|nr:hypothetical protein [Conexibacter sp.]
MVLAAGLWLARPLGALLSPPAHGYTFTAGYAPLVRPEPTEHARYLIALSLPLLIAFATIFAPRWLPRLSPSRARIAVTSAQALLALVLAACYVAQVRLRYGFLYTHQDGNVFQMRYFTTATVVAAGLLSLATIAVVRQGRLRHAAAALMRDSRARGAAGWTLAIVATVLWLLHAVATEGSLASAPADVPAHVAFTLDETFAVLNGMSPLVDFTAQYGSLWPYATAPLMLVFGKTVLTFSLAMCALTGLALLAIYAVLRRVTRSAIAALLLYLPFLATSLFTLEDPPQDRSSLASYGTFPLRYAGPYLLALLTARHIDRDSGPRGIFLLFLVGGLTILNNVEFGVAALGATVAAVAWAGAGRPGASPRRLLAAAGGGLLAALALVSLLTLLRAGALPQLGRVTDYARLFGVSGYASMPIPSLLGMHLVIYVTYVAAIVVATVSTLGRARDRLLSGMLAWAGIFGLGSASYYVGRSHPVALKATFSVWALALALLTVVVVRALAAHPRRLPSIAAVVTLFGFGVAACSLGQTPTPWSQVDRLRAPSAPTETSAFPRPLAPATDPQTRAFVSSLADGPSRFVVKHGAPIAIMLRTGHRVADAYGVRNVSPYTGSDSTPTVERVETVLDLLARAGGNTVIVSNAVDPAMFSVLERRGFLLITHHGLGRYDPTVPHSDAVMLPWPDGTTVIKWVDTRHLRADALR